MTIQYDELNSLPDTSFIAGTDKVLTFTAYEDDGVTLLNVLGGSGKWLLCPFGQYDRPTLAKDAVIVDNNTMSVSLTYSDSISLSGKYVQQFVITDYSGHIFRPAQGIVIILPAIGATVGAVVWAGSITKGDIGVQGVTGAPGSAASQGATGPQGITGIPGTAASQGATGLQGPTGIQGLTGAGIQGITGLKGATGVGATGAQGVTGIQGITGIPGTAASQGATGQRGTTGTQGATGAGIQGATGVQGIAGSGITGAQGITGIRGATGTPGTAASQGATGPQGIQGIQGITGAGIQGPTGIRGITGIQALADVTDTTLGTSTVLGVSPYGLAQSIFGQKVVQICLNGSAPLDGTEVGKFRVPPSFNLMVLTGIYANCGLNETSGASSSGITYFTLNNFTQSLNMLSTNLSIDQGGYDSDTAFTPVVINTSNYMVQTNDVLYVETDGIGVGVTYVIITLTFGLPD